MTIDNAIDDFNWMVTNFNCQFSKWQAEGCIGWPDPQHMGYRWGYLCGFYFAVDMFRLDAIAHKYQRGYNCIISYYFYFRFRIVIVDGPSGLQLDDQVATA